MEITVDDDYAPMARDILRADARLTFTEASRRVLLLSKRVTFNIEGPAKSVSKAVEAIRAAEDGAKAEFQTFSL